MIRGFEFNDIRWFLFYRIKYTFNYKNILYGNIENESGQNM